MAAAGHILSLDQGTTSSRAILFDTAGTPLATAQRELPQIFPRPGWVEHDARVIWRDTLDVAREALANAGLDATALDAIGITNQRETTVLWDRSSGTPLANAIVWQDRRTVEHCRSLREAGHEALFTERTGLLLDPYFSGTKLAWLLDDIPGARARAEAGELAFGTIDCWLLWNLTEGGVHATDATNASRTLLFDIHRQCWDVELLEILNIPAGLLPEVRDCAGPFGRSAAALLGHEVPIAGIAGDQHAATIGEACFTPGMVKSTYGTGCFVLANTGQRAVASRNRLLTTVAYRLDGETTYALEGSIFVAGAAVQWLRDGLGLLQTAGESEGIAASISHTGGVYLVPAFTGLGAPYWDADARGALVGLTRDSGRAEIVRATLEAVGYQTRDLLDAMAADMGGALSAVRVDGGMVANDWLMGFLADITDCAVERPRVQETTALGAAYLASLGVGLYPSLDAVGDGWRLERRFEPTMAAAERAARLAGWDEAVARTRT